MTETNETTEGNVTKALATQLFILRAIFVSILAVAVLAVATAWATVDVAPIAAPVADACPAGHICTGAGTGGGAPGGGGGSSTPTSCDFVSLDGGAPVLLGCSGSGGSLRVTGSGGSGSDVNACPPMTMCAAPRWFGDPAVAADLNGGSGSGGLACPPVGPCVAGEVSGGNVAGDAK